ADLNRLYLDSPALWTADETTEGFTWLDCHREEHCVYAFVRTGGGQRLEIVLNFSAADQEMLFLLPAENPPRTVYHRLSRDWQPYGGAMPAGESPLALRENTLTGTLAAFSGVVMELQ